MSNIPLTHSPHANIPLVKTARPSTVWRRATCQRLTFLARSCQWSTSASTRSSIRGRSSTLIRYAAAEGRVMNYLVLVELPNELHICSNRIGQIPSSPYLSSTWWYIVLPGVCSLCFCRAQEGENTTSRPDLVVVVAMTRHGLLTRWGPFLRVTAKHKASY